jgi:hypothetical protein
MEDHMHKFLHTYFILTSIVILIAATSILSAQVTFTQSDATNQGITTTDGMQGFAWGDYDGDGDMDLFQSGVGNPSILYNNDVLGDSGKFVDVTAQGVLVDSTGGYAEGAIWLDYNNDGHLDLLSVDAGLKLYKNDGGGASFTDVSVETGLSDIDAGVQLWQITAADFEHDGDLDLAIAGGDQGAGSDALPTRLLIYDEGTYTDQADAIIGFELILESWNPMWVDVNNDGFLDLWLPTIRTTEECALLYNRSGVELEFLTTGETGIEAGSAIASSWADFDNDGDMDLFLTPYSGDADGVSKFFLNDNGTSFMDIAEDLGLNQEYAGSRGSAWGDFDNDGNIDLLVGDRTEAQHLFRNEGGTFVDVSEETGADTSGIDTRSVMFVDYDNDGFLDIYLASGPKCLYHNSGNDNHWIGFILQGNGTTNNAAAIGARVRVVTGDLKQIRDIQAGGPGGMANGNLRAHFGLGEATSVDSVIIRWPNGLISELTDLAIDQYHTLSETALGITHKPTVIPTKYALYQNYPNPFNPVTTISFAIPVRTHIRIDLVNTLGETVKRITNTSYAAGQHEVILDGSNLASGLYFYRLEAGSFVDVKKLVLLK